MSMYIYKDGIQFAEFGNTFFLNNVRKQVLVHIYVRYMIE